MLNFGKIKINILTLVLSEFFFSQLRTPHTEQAYSSDGQLRIYMPVP